MNHSFLKIIIFLSLCISSYAASVSTVKIKKWLGNKRIEVSKLQKIYLVDNERAYLVDITFDRDDDIIKKALIRPEMEEAEFLPNFATKYEIIDLDHDGVSELVFTKMQITPSYIQTTKTISQLNEYELIPLYSVSYKTQKQCTLCLKESINWNFSDENTDKIKDLIQSYTLELTSPQNTTVLSHHKDIIYFKNSKFNHPYKSKELSQMILSHDVENRIPSMPSQEFSMDDKQVTCFLDFKNVKKEEKIVYKWIDKDLETILSRTQVIKPAKRYRTWMSKIIKDKSSYEGDWIVLIMDNNKVLLDFKEFKIKPSIKEAYAQDNNLSSLIETKHPSTLTDL